ncbi:response regulator [Stigmatella aurantiaca]|uniref:Two component, sigma54 specific, transcriptional regulator, Fis family n=1 Tax=Stigmatella aurantiaca (strain DW4/3-1) TaxID=378806 RepID=Q08U14_STIAD|nr:response regulator [Stigmatella aurantiaca]EAU63973.1 two component, sigma54 specific, transcriptional regulator, Fis family [Stigmatella aurantiaca DW4/3-1]
MEINQRAPRRRHGFASRQASSAGIAPPRGRSSLPRRTVQDIASSGGISVLVIDDEPDMRELISLSLPSAEFEVVLAEGGRAAVALLATRRFDVAVTDLKSLDSTGMETVTVLRQMDPDMEVIVATSYVSPETARACMKYGAYDYIRKPYEIEELRHVLLRAVEKRRLRSLVPLYEVSCALLSLRTRAEVLAHLGELALDLVPHQAFRLMLPDPETGVLGICSSPDGLDLPVEALRELGQRAIQRQEPVSVTHAARDWPFSPVARLGAAMAYPLQVGTAPAGSLILLRGIAQPAFSVSELQRGSLFSAQLALALETARLNSEMDARVKDMVSARGEMVKAEKLATAGKLAAGLTHELSNPLAFTKASLQALTGYSRNVKTLSATTRDVAHELASRGEPRLMELARRLLAVTGSEAQAAIQDSADAAEDAVDGIRRVEGLLSELRTLSGDCPVAPAEHLDVTPLLCTWQEKGQLARPIRVEAPNAVFAHVGRQELESSLMRLVTFLCDIPLERPGASQEAVVLRADYDKNRPVIWLEDPLLVLTEERRSDIFDARIQEDSHGGRTMRLNLSLALAYQVLRRMGADLAVLPAASGGSVFRLLLPASPPAGG